MEIWNKMRPYEEVCEEAMFNEMQKVGDWASILCNRLKRNILKCKAQNNFNVNGKKYIVKIKVKVEEVEAWQVEEAKPEERKSKRKK